jgi:hypothetical protein
MQEPRDFAMRGQEEEEDSMLATRLPPSLRFSHSEGNHVDTAFFYKPFCKGHMLENR